MLPPSRLRAPSGNRRAGPQASSRWGEPIEAFHPLRAMLGPAGRGTLLRERVIGRKRRYGMFRRRRPLARAAVVGGVAYHAGKKRQEGQQADEERDMRLDELEQQQAMQGAPPPAAA